MPPPPRGVDAPAESPRGIPPSCQKALIRELASASDRSVGGDTAAFEGSGLRFRCWALSTKQRGRGEEGASQFYHLTSRKELVTESHAVKKQTRKLTFFRQQGLKREAMKTEGRSIKK